MYVGYITKGFNWIGHYDVNPIRDSKAALKNVS